MAGLLSRFRSDSAGAIVIVLAIALPVFLGIIGLAVDVANWYLSKREAQTAADAGAIAGAWTYLHTSSTSDAQLAAIAGATENGFTSGVKNQTVTINMPPTSGSYSGDSTAVEVVVSELQPSFFASLLFAGVTTVEVRAVAASSALPGDFCILALNPTAGRAINLHGNPDVDLGCGVASNSSAGDAVYVGGSSSLTADPVSAVGQVSGQSNITGNVAENQTAATDPYGSAGRNLQAPSFSGCDESGGNFNSNHDFAPSVAGGIFVFCGNTTLKKKHDFAPGIYIFNGAELKINSSADVTGDNVTFIFTGSGSNYGNIWVNGNADIDLSATNYDTTSKFGSNFQGILFFQDSGAPNQSNSNKFNGGSRMSLEGAIYFPNQEIEFSGNDGSGSKCLQIIADTVTFGGNADLGNSCSSGVDIDSPSIQDVALFE